MKHDGRGVVRINDRTDHGGTVTGASSGTVVMGQFAALEGDMTFCPKCKGSFAIKTDKAGAKHEGRHYAYHGDVTECGAHLISSLSPATSACMARTTGTMPTSAPSTSGAPEAAEQYIDRILLIDSETHEALDGRAYEVKRERESTGGGKTDPKGVTERLKI
ncbi:MAG: PAAR domain-containing protein [Pseudomonadota bacterium]